MSGDLATAAATGPLRWAGLWQTLGWAGLLAIIVVSLLPMPPGALDVPGSDKIGHLFAYFLLTFGHSQLGISQRAILWRAGGFLLVGALLEVAQSYTGYRSGDPRDLLANTMGIAFGLAIGTAMPGWLKTVEARLENRLVQRGWVRGRR